MKSKVLTEKKRGKYNASASHLWQINGEKFP